MPEFSPRVCPLNRFYPHALSSCEVACGMITLALIRPDGSTDGRFTSHPSLNHLPTSLRDIKFRASEPLLVLRASGVQIRYSFSVEVNATFPGALHRHRGLFFCTSPLSSPAINSKCYSHSLTFSSRSIYITYSHL
jgi:hypothetical protein